jgi:hypothetical protein
MIIYLTGNYDYNHHFFYFKDEWNPSGQVYQHSCVVTANRWSMCPDAELDLSGAGTLKNYSDR